MKKYVKGLILSLTAGIFLSVGVPHVSAEISVKNVKQTVVLSQSTVLDAAQAILESYGIVFTDEIRSALLKVLIIQHSDFRLTQPRFDNLVLEGNQNLRVAWAGANEADDRVIYRLLTHSANYYCVKSGAEICPQDVSEVVSQIVFPGDKSGINISQPRDRVGRFIVELEYRGKIVYSDPVTIGADK